MVDKYYRLHDLVSVKITDEAGFLSGFFHDVDKKYANFKTEPMKIPDITIRLGAFDPSNKDCTILDDNYYLNADYLYCKKTSYKIANWKFELAGIEKGPIVAKISNNIVGGMFISGDFIDPLLQYALNNKGCSIIHASGVCKNGNAFLFPARSGGGKTTIALKFVEQGYDFMGDNFIILQNGYALSYFSPLNIFTYNLSPFVRKNIKTGDRLKLSLKSLLYKATAGYVKIFSKFNPVEFTEKIADRAPLKKVFFIFPKNEFRIDPMSKGECIEHLIINQKFEFMYFDRHFLEYTTQFPRGNFATHWERYRKNLESNLPDQIPYYRVEVPSHYSPNVFEEISKMLEESAGERELSAN